MNFTQLFIAIFGYTYLIISVIGFITNLISFIILSSKTFRNTVFSSYFRFIAFFNILSMIIPINKFLEYNLNIWIRDFSDSLCKFRMYYFYILFPVYCWGLVAISIDRFIAISYPNKFSFRKKTTFQILVCIIILTFNCIYYIPLLFSFVKISKQFNNKTNQTIISQRCSNNVYSKDWFNTFNTTIIPFSIMFIFTLLTLINLFKSRKIASNCKTKQKDIKFAITTISLNVIFLFLNLPYSTYSIINFYISDSIDKELEKLIYSIVYVPYYFNLITIFFINVTVNKMFQDEFKRIFFKINKKEITSRVEIRRETVTIIQMLNKLN